MYCFSRALYVVVVAIAVIPVGSIGAPERLVTTKINVCQDEAQWPPFAYRDIAQKKEFAGLSFEVLNLVFQDSKYEVVIAWMPWSRCLGLAQKGEMDIVLDLYHSADRARFLDYSVPYFQLNSSLFYLADKKINMESVKSSMSLEGLRACGRREFDYSHFKIRNKDFVALANSYEQLYNLLLKDRCDYFPEEAEIIVGLGLTGKPPWPPKALLQKKADWIQGPQVHWGVSKKSKYRQELLQMIDSKFNDFKRHPELFASLKKKYGL